MRVILIFILFVSKLGECQTILALRTVRDTIVVGQLSDSINSGFSIQLIAKNQSSSAFKIPLDTRANERDSYEVYEVGYEFFKDGKKDNCVCEIDYGPLPKLQSLAGNQSRVINAYVLGDCFRKPAIYCVTFYVKFVFGDNYNNSKLLYEAVSNKLIIIVK
jgi:hypothetical protein